MSRKRAIDEAVETAVTGKKPMWQRAGMTRAEYERGKQQLAEERRRRNAQTTDRYNP